MAEFLPLFTSLPFVILLAAALLAIVSTILLMTLSRKKAEQVQQSLFQDQEKAQALLEAELKNCQSQLQSYQNDIEALQGNLNASVEVADAARIEQAELRSRLQLSEKQAAEQQQKIVALEQKSEADQSKLAKQLAVISELETRAEEQQKQNAEKLKLLDEAREQMSLQFKSLANDIFDAKQKRFKEQNQTQLDGLLKPLGEKIKDFEKRVETAYSAESKERFSLIKEVKNLQDLNARISRDAINLTNALKGESKTQGTWGEVILERVLEKSGLVKGREYEVQQSLKSEEGKRLQPDVIVRLPDGKDLIIDSKVSLVAYERFCSAEDELERESELKLHIQSLRTHIKGLSQKDYQNLEGLRTLDFVLLFVPVEAAFSVAVQQDGELFAEAFDKNIVLVAPSTLLATLRTIQNIWRFENQNKNAQDIANRAGQLYDKFTGFVESLEDIGGKLSSVQTAYEKARGQLTEGRGNVLRQVEMLKQLGAKASKSLPPKLTEIALADDEDSSSEI